MEEKIVTLNQIKKKGQHWAGYINGMFLSDHRKQCSQQAFETECPSHGFT